MAIILYKRAGVELEKPIVLDINHAGGQVEHELDDSAELTWGDVMEVIASLDSNDAENFTSSGKPQVDAINRALDGRGIAENISASERDKAWNELNG